MKVIKNILKTIWVLFCIYTIVGVVYLTLAIIADSGNKGIHKYGYPPFAITVQID